MPRHLVLTSKGRKKKVDVTSVFVLCAVTFKTTARKTRRQFSRIAPELHGPDREGERGRRVLATERLESSSKMISDKDLVKEGEEEERKRRRERR